MMTKNSDKVKIPFMDKKEVEEFKKLHPCGLAPIN